MNVGQLWQVVAVLHMLADRLADAADAMDAEDRKPPRKVKRKPTGKRKSKPK